METKVSIHSSADLRNFLELQGYCILNNTLSKNLLDLLNEELSKLERKYQNNKESYPNVDFLEEPTRFMVHNLQFEDCPNVHNLIVSGLVFDFLSNVTGDNLICTGCTYSHCKPGYQGIPFHTDYDPYSNNTYRPSNPIALRVLYYLDDLSLDKACLKLIPHSHLSLHKSRHPNNLIKDNDKDQIEIECTAGTSIIINTKLFHSVGPNKADSGRRVLAITYRPEWAAPLHAVDEHPPERLATLSPQLTPFFYNLNNINKIE